VARTSETITHAGFSPEVDFFGHRSDSNSITGDMNPSTVWPDAHDLLSVAGRSSSIGIDNSGRSLERVHDEARPVTVPGVDIHEDSLSGALNIDHVQSQTTKLHAKPRDAADLTQGSAADLAANNSVTSNHAAAASMSAANATVTAAAAAAGDFPDETNTGVPSGTTLTKYNGTLTINQDNAVISNMEVTGSIIINADNVTLKNIKLISTADSHALRIMDNATGFTMMDSEIDGQGRTTNGIYGKGDILRTDIHDVENGMNLLGDSLIQDNYIHDLNMKGSPHYDGIEINSGHDIQMIHNTIINDHTQTSAIMMGNNFGGLYNIDVENNRLVGGGYTVYVDTSKGSQPIDSNSINISYNQIGGGVYGDFAFYENHPITKGNVDLDTLPSEPTDPVDTRIVGTMGNDVMPDTGKSNTGDETYLGLGGNDKIKGGEGADTLNGGDGRDTASYVGSSAVKVNLASGSSSGGDASGDSFASIEKLIGSQQGDTLDGSDIANRLEGRAGDDTIRGGGGNDRMFGGTGNDTLDGQDGIDQLTGGTGNDNFVFHESTLKTAGGDHITDFSARDTLFFDTNSGATGHISADSFVLGTNALDSNDHFIFDTSKHQLFYDSDGNGSSQKVLVATFENGFTLNADDIWQV
jgi:Ca2+-binding RTX toxin-like protein